MADESSYVSSSYEGEGEGSVPSWFFIAVNVIVCLITVLGNAMVILAYIRDDKIRRTVAYTIILNLSIADLLVGISIFPLNTLWWVADEWTLGTIPCKLWLVLDYSLFSVSTFSIVFISLDRYWLLTKGLSYQEFQTRRQVVIVLSVGWVVTILVYSIVALIVPAISTFESEFDPTDCELEVVQTTWFNIFEIVVNFIIPFAALVFLNYKVFRNIRRRSKGLVTNNYDYTSETDTAVHDTTAIRDTSAGYNYAIMKASELEQKDEVNNLIVNTPSRNDGDKDETLTNDDDSFETNDDTEDGEKIPSVEITNGANRSEDSLTVSPSGGDGAPAIKMNARMKKKLKEFRRYRKAAITLAALVSVYCVCCLPYFVYAIVVSFCKECVSYRAWEFFAYLQWCNSTMNPFVYGLTNVLFRRNFVKFMGLHKCLKLKG